MQSSATSRRGGWWGIAFVVTLFVSGAMVTLPTARQTGRAIAAFYAAHTGVILVQQVLGVVTLAFFLAFALALGARRRRWLLVGTVLVAISELVTNIVPVVLALTNPEPDGAHAWTVIEDLADEALFISIASPMRHCLFPSRSFLSRRQLTRLGGSAWLDCWLPPFRSCALC